MAFITGSRAYGTPREDSDIDLVVKVTPHELAVLANFADSSGCIEVESEEDYEDEFSQKPKPAKRTNSVPLRFGPLNLICCVDDAIYEAWMEGTEQLKGSAPVSRGDAIQLLRRLRSEALHEGAA